MLESGTAIDDLSPAAKEKANKYFTVKRWGGKITATANNKAIKDANKYHGYFALVSNKEKDPFECLRKYRKRETIESFFEAEKRKRTIASTCSYASFSAIIVSHDTESKKLST